jgi:hypothetical protein
VPLAGAPLAAAAEESCVALPEPVVAPLYSRRPRGDWRARLYGEAAAAALEEARGAFGAAASRAAATLVELRVGGAWVVARVTAVESLGRDPFLGRGGGPTTFDGASPPPQSPHFAGVALDFAVRHGGARVTLVASPLAPPAGAPGALLPAEGPLREFCLPIASPRIAPLWTHL